jgi:magnesium chelatase subunit D
MSPVSPELPGNGALTALLLAVDPQGLGGVVLDHPHHEHARVYQHRILAALPDGAPSRRLPAGVTADRLYGGVDLATTLATGRLVAERGVLAASDGGVLVVPMAERLAVAGRTALAAALDSGSIQVAREGIAEVHDARVCLLLLDESVEDELVHPALRDRVAFAVSLDGPAVGELEAMAESGADRHWRLTVREARRRLPTVSVDEGWVRALCETADAFGVDSVRAVLLALRCARAVAALRGRLTVSESDAERAAQLVLAPRATRLPVPPEQSLDDASPEPPPPPPPTDATPPDADHPEEAADPEEHRGPGGELLREAVAAALPAGLLAQLLARAQAGGAAGRVGEETPNLLRGRPRGARTGLPRGGARLHLLETLRAAAPWQRVRSTAPAKPAAPSRARVRVRREDFRIRRFIEKTGTTVIFVVDASGSSAIHRLGEAKGAIERLLAESYARRDRVCLVAFRGPGTELLLPPTRALARARRVLAALPGGGGTPMAHAMDAALEQALAARRGGSAPLVVFLTDGRANIARDGTPGRPRAEQDALAGAARLAQQRVSSLFVDTSPRGEVMARRLAEAMHGRYVRLPDASAEALGGLVRTAMTLADGAGA